MAKTLIFLGGGRHFGPSQREKGGKALNLSPRLPKGGQRCKGGDSRG